ncbi:AbfB domain-containing protein, partial [Deinococcus sp.]|uniref:AbfB domain-containing protein n=1 Tax=Deinococcus sp. TaxID=47478 RepID=UPI003B5B225A
MTRPDWLNLNGKWDYNGGRAAPSAENPPTTAPDFPNNPEQILVPYPTESYLSGIGRRDERNMWYKRSFTVPADWNGKHVMLNFGAVDRVATVYVNGQQVGRHQGGYTEFGFDVTPYLRAGNNDLVVGVFDSTDGSDMVGKQSLTETGLFYTPTSGIWQTVWLEPVAQPHITRLELTPDVAGNRLRVTAYGADINGQTIEAVVAGSGSATGNVGKEFSVPISSPHLWSPSDPFLYTLTIRLRSGGTVVDEVGSYFGMRSLTIGTIRGVPRPLLNGQFLFQFGTLDQGFWPDGIYTPPTEEAIKADLQTIKNLGFNMVRKHIKVEPQRWYYWADKLGLMVWQDMPNPGRDDKDNPSPLVRSRFEAAAHDIVNQHRNSPAIVQWDIFNEGWGDYEIPRLATLFKSWDASRWIDAHTGINWGPGDTGAGDIIDTHDFDHDYPGPAAPQFQPNRPAVTGEYGGFALKVPGHLWTPGVNCCQFSDLDRLTTKYIEYVNYLRENIGSRGLSAAVYTQFTDIEDEINGLVTYDRVIQKMDFARVRAANTALVNKTPFLQPGAPYSFKAVTPGSDTRYMRHFNSLGFTEVVDVNSVNLLKQDATWKVVTGLADAGCFSFEAIDKPGKFLRHQAFRLRIDPNDSDQVRQDATFCLRTALDGSGKISLESKNLPGNYIRHRGGELWLDPVQDSDLYRLDASWQPAQGWWHSAVVLPTGGFKSIRVTTPGFDTRYLRHIFGQAFTAEVNAGSDATLKADATWRIVSGLADGSCYSLESRNFPGEYLR